MMEFNKLLEAQTHMGRCSECKEQHARVKCIECNQDFSVNSGEYIIIAGDIYVGNEGGIVGANFNPDGTLGNLSIFCYSCFRDFINKTCDEIEKNKE